MENLLIEFVNTFDLSLKKIQAEVGDNSGISKLTISQLQYIDAIYMLGEPSITELAARLHFTKASVTSGIQKLIQLGYVGKKQSREDKRVFHVSLTESGRLLVKAKYQALKEYGEFIGSVLSKEEARQFEAALTKIVKLFRQV